jgi:hypothetical protein
MPSSKFSQTKECEVEKISLGEAGGQEQWLCTPLCSPSCTGQGVRVSDKRGPGYEDSQDCDRGTEGSFHSCLKFQHSVSECKGIPGTSFIVFCLCVCRLSADLTIELRPACVYTCVCVCVCVCVSARVVLGIDPGSALTLELCPHYFALVIFEIGSYILAWASLERCPPIYASHVVGTTGMHYLAQIVIGWDGVLRAFCMGMVLTHDLSGIAANFWWHFVTEDHIAGLRPPCVPEQTVVYSSYNS